MKLKQFLIIFILIAAVNTAFAQPTATVQFVVGYSIPLGDYSGTFGETRDQFTHNGNPDSNSYFMKPGINYGIFVKIPIRKRSPLSIKGGVAFNIFSQSKEYIEGTGSVTVDLKQSLFVISLGSDYDFGGRKSKIKPFLSAEISGNFFAGSYSENYVDSTESLSLNPVFRLGINAGAGLDFKLHHNIGFLVGAKYSIANIIGKNYKDDTRTKYNLNDAGHSKNNISIPSRTITYLQIYGGLSFYFGR